MFEPTPNLKRRFDETPLAAKKLLADILTDAILGSSIPEEAKIEVKIMKAYGELDQLMAKTARDFACPVPFSGEGEEVARRIYPARQAFLEYLQLTRAGLDNFLANVPIPDIPPEYRKRAENPFDRI